MYLGWLGLRKKFYFYPIQTVSNAGSQRYGYSRGGTS